MSARHIDELKCISHLVSDLSGIGDLATLRLNMVRAVARRLISAADGSFNQVDYQNQAIRWVSIRPMPGESEREEFCTQHFSSHPITQAHGIAASPQVLRLSDFLSQRLLERHPLFDGLYRPIGMRYMLALRLAPGIHSQTISLLRSDRDFSNRDIKMFEAFAPFAQMLIRCAMERDQFSQVLTAISPGRGVIGLDLHTDDIAWVNDCAREHLARHFAWKRSDPLPAMIVRWLLSPGAPLVHRTPDQQVTISFLRDNRQRLLVSEARSTVTQPELLEVLGLTKRQAEVLFWLARGKSDKEIGVILDASVHTIHRHVEAVYSRLGVDSRSAATLRAVKVLGVQ